MAETSPNIAPANWQVTATTIECELIKEYVTIMVNRDWSCKCTWWAKHKKVAGEDPKHKFSGDVKAKIGKCQGPDCKFVTGYRDKLIEEETAVKK